MSLWLLRKFIQYGILRKDNKNDRLKSARIDIAQLKGDQLNKIDIPDEVDGCEYIQLVDGRFQCENGEVKVRYVQPFFYHVIFVWALVELFILSYALLRMDNQDGYADNFVHGFCENGYCDRLIRRMILYKILSALLLAIGGYKVERRRAFLHQWKYKLLEE